MISDIPHDIITGLIYPAILGALVYNIYEYYSYYYKNDFRDLFSSIINCLKYLFSIKNCLGNLFFIRSYLRILFSIRNVLVILFFVFYFFNFLRVRYADSCDYDWKVFLCDFIETVFMYRGFKMLIDPEMNPGKNKTCLKKAYLLGFFVLINMILWKIISKDHNLTIFIMNIISIALMINGWAWGFKKSWYNRYLMFLFCFLLVGIYALVVYNLPK